MSEHYGKIQQTNGIQGFIEINRPFLGSYFHNSYKAPAKRFDYGFGAEAMAEYTSSTDYLKYNAPTGEFEKISRHPGRISLRQLWAGVKWRSLHLTAGMREHTPLCTPTLGSGDLVYSRNARPIPQVRIGFADFRTYLSQTDGYRFSAIYHTADLQILITWNRTITITTHS